jgi:pimeloyl-ACP methyl ester carboxylesterase
MFIEVDGRKAYAYTGGKAFDPSLPCVVFVHGAQHDHSVWILQSRYLAHHGYAVLAVDLPGHGRSDGPALNSVEAMADWTIAMIRTAGCGQAAIIGHSMGSLIALDAAARHPDQVSRIALVGAAFPMKVSDALLEATRNDEPRALEMINLWTHSAVTHRPGNPGPGFSVFIENLRLMQRQAPGVLYNDFKACNDYQTGAQSAAQVRCPALFVLGERDQMTPPRAARGLIDAIADTQVVTVPRCGHALMAERPDAVLDAIKPFLASMQRQQSAA